MKKLKYFNKALNYKILSALPVMGICLITDKQISNSMFKSTLKTITNTSQPSATNSPNTKVTYLYRNGRKLAIVSGSSSNLTSGTSSTKTSLPQRTPSSTNPPKNTASSISGTKTSSVTATSHKLTTSKLDNKPKISSTTNIQSSLSLEDKNTPFSTVFARYVYFDGDDSDSDNSPTPTTPRSLTPEVDDTLELSSTVIYNFFDLDEDTSSSVNYNFFDFGEDTSSTPAKSPTFELEDYPEISSSATQTLFNSDEGTPPTIIYNFFDLDEGTLSTFTYNFFDFD